MSISSVNPINEAIGGPVEETSPTELELVLHDAHGAVTELRWTTAIRRAEWMRAVAGALSNAAGALVEIAGRETGLPEARLTGELRRTHSQLTLIADYIQTGAPFQPTIDTADPEWVPTPRPDLRSLRLGIGPVLVFAASNFPFAFSVAGGDTASAWAAGCPVIVKSHPGHPQLSEAVATLVRHALHAAGAPKGTFALIHGVQPGVNALRDPRIAAGSFTGSLAGGRALFDIAASRPQPIPFFAEMGSINPVVITAAAARERPLLLADELAESFLLGNGQFCTKPGIVLVPAASEIPAALAAIVSTRSAGVMLSTNIRDRHRHDLAQLSASGPVSALAVGRPAPAVGAFEQSSVHLTTVAGLTAFPEQVAAECFGPSTVLVTYRDQHELHDALAVLPGSLTASVQRGQDENVGDLITFLVERAGRVIVDEWPTGVAVTWAQMHGGPYPATTDPRATSVGTAAVDRFLRPVAFQNAPDDALPGLLRDAATPGVLRRIDGHLSDRSVQRTR